jgi:hypothetical protein
MRTEYETRKQYEEEDDAGGRGEKRKNRRMVMISKALSSDLSFTAVTAKSTVS